MPTGKPFNPAGISKPSVGQALFNLGMQKTRWIPVDGSIGQLQEGRFDPTSNSPIQRYGNPKGLAVKIWPAEQYTGIHSRKHNPHAIRLAPIVLGAMADPQQDTLDLNFVVGATQYVLAQAFEQAKTNPELRSLMSDLGMFETGPATPPPAPPPTPPAPLPTPPPPPIPATPIPRRVEELRNLALQAIGAGQEGPWLKGFVQSDFVGLIFARAVEIYRKVKTLP
jgi:hypothetical protein